MKIIITLMVFTFVSLTSFAKDCTYQSNEKDFNVKWTAYKTPLKAPVSGSFKNVGIKKIATGTSIKELLQGIEFKINSATVDSKNPGRDVKIVKFFFSPMLGGLEIKGKTLKFDKKVLKVAITMNQVTKIIPLRVQISTKKIEANGVIDLLDFAMIKSLSGLNKACNELHQGKTWNDVAVKLSVNYSSKCK